jgi:hypothetical protein
VAYPKPLKRTGCPPLVKMYGSLILGGSSKTQLRLQNLPGLPSFLDLALAVRSAGVSVPLRFWLIVTTRVGARLFEGRGFDAGEAEGVGNSSIENAEHVDNQLEPSCG